MLFLPPFSPGDQLPDDLRTRGYAVVDDQVVCSLADSAPGDLAALSPFWNRLPPDQHLKDGGRYRRRRHGSWVIERGQAVPVPHRAHWQPVDYNALHGGIERWFEPIEPAMADDVAFKRLLSAFSQIADGLWPGVPRWYLEAHPFRIDCTDGIGRPTPEGAHRDGVDLVVVLLVSRHSVRGGETRVFEAQGPQGVRFTLSQPWSALLLDDARVIHESTPIQPEVPTQPGWRDTLVLTYRRNGFQDPPAHASPDAPRNTGARA